MQLYYSCTVAIPVQHDCNPMVYDTSDEAVVVACARVELIEDFLALLQLICLNEHQTHAKSPNTML